jgi:enamine deaminase RidA (YjgF/YER057c/UK114 family)
MSDGAIRFTTILPEGWPRPKGFAQAVKASGSAIVRVSGQLGRAPDAAGVEAGSSLGQQWRLALANVIAVVRASGGDIGDIVMLRAYVTDMDEFNAGGHEVAEAWSATFGRHIPAMTLVGVTGLVDPHARVEIEAEAVLA